MNVKPYKFLEMQKTELKPYHQSCIDSIKALEEELLNLFADSPETFIIRYRIQAGTLLDQMNRTFIPSKHLSQTLEGLNFLYQNFIERHEKDVINEEIISYENEKKLIHESFSTSIKNITKRITGDVDAMNQAKNLEEAILIGFDCIPLGSSFVGPKGEIRLNRNNLPKGHVSVAEVVVMSTEEGNKKIYFCAGWGQNEQTYHLQANWSEKIEDWSDKW